MTKQKQFLSGMKSIIYLKTLSVKLAILSKKVTTHKPIKMCWAVIPMCLMFMGRV